MTLRLPEVHCRNSIDLLNGRQKNPSYETTIELIKSQTSLSRAFADDGMFEKALDLNGNALDLVNASDTNRTVHATPVGGRT